DLREGGRIGHREIGQHLAVELDVRLSAAGDELVVGEPFLSRRGVDPDDPEAPEVALPVLPVTVRVDERVLDLLLRPPVGLALEPPVALGLLEDLAPLLAGVDRSFDSRHYFLPRSDRTSFRSLATTCSARRKLRFRFGAFLPRLWLRIAWRRSSFPPAVSLNRFFAALFLFCFGISASSRADALRRPEHHDHVPPVEERRGLHHSDLLHVLRQPHQEVSTALRVRGLAPPEHDRDLDLRALPEEALDVAFLRVVVVNSDLRSELDLLDVDLRLVLPRELGLLLLLVPVLPVVHDLRHRRIGLGCDLDEVEVLGIRVVERLGGLLDPQLLPVLVDEPHARRPDRIVDSSLRNRADGLDEPPWSQRAFTKLLAPPSETTKPLQAAAR